MFTLLVPSPNQTLRYTARNCVLLLGRVDLQIQILIKKKNQTDALISQIYFWNKTLHEIIRNANLTQQCNFINVFLARLLAVGPVKVRNSC